VAEVELVVAHSERATLRVDDVFLKIDADQARLDVEVEAMAMAPILTPEVLWRKPPCSRSPPLRGRHSAASANRRSASSAAWAAAGAAVRMLHDAPLPALAQLARARAGIAPRRRMRVARHQRRPFRRPGRAQPPGC
jgi:hypothetical protein